MGGHVCRPFRALSAGLAAPGLKAWAIIFDRFAVNPTGRLLACPLSRLRRCFPDPSVGIHFQLDAGSEAGHLPGSSSRGVAYG